MAKGLGRGLHALFPDQEGSVEEIKVKDLRPNPYQPRKSFHDDAINELKDSIEEYGILQPLLVRKSIKGYDIVAGERRFRAAASLGFKTVPAIIKELSDERMMEIALIENLQREDLNPLEEARAYEKLMTYLNVTQEELSKRLGKSRPHIANYLRLLQLPEDVQEKIVTNRLSMGHGRALLGLKDKQNAASAIAKIEKEGLNVRQTEELVQRLNNHVSRETKQNQKRNDKHSPFLKSKEEDLRTYFGTSVSIKKGKRKGKIEIEFMTEEDLERILELLEKK